MACAKPRLLAEFLEARKTAKERSEKVRELSGYTPVQCLAICAVEAHPGISQRELSEFLGSDTSTLSEVLRRLKKRGALMFSASPNDGRATSARLTDVGQRAYGKIVRTVGDLPEDLRDPNLFKKTTKEAA